MGIIRSGASSSDVWYIAGQCALNTGEHDKAESYFRSAIGITADDAEFHYGLGRALHLQGDYAQAVSKYEDALRIDPGSELYKDYRVRAYLGTETYLHGVEIAEGLVGEYPGSDLYQETLAWALVIASRNQMTRLDDGRELITSKKQFDYAQDALNRLHTLRIEDTQLTELVGNLKDDVVSSRRNVWIRLQPARFTVWLVVFNILLMAALGISVGALLPQARDMGTMLILLPAGFVSFIVNTALLTRRFALGRLKAGCLTFVAGWILFTISFGVITSSVDWSNPVVSISWSQGYGNIGIWLARYFRLIVIYAILAGAIALLIRLQIRPLWKMQRLMLKDMQTNVTSWGI